MTALRLESLAGKRNDFRGKGWQWLAERPKANGDVGFVAMAFARSLDGLRDAICQGIRAAGYLPLRVDGDEYNGAVVDQVIARIRESRFVVADFKLNRGGVYYAAGFAEGLGMEVFYLCEDVQVGEAPRRTSGSTSTFST